MEEGAVKFSTNLYLCLMIFVFVHNYGEELEIIAHYSGKLPQILVKWGVIFF